MQTEPTSIQEKEDQSQPLKEQTVKEPSNSGLQNATALQQHSGLAETSGSKPPPPFPQRFQKQQQDGKF